MGLLDGSTRSASILAETDVTAVKLPRKEFLDLVDRHAEIARALLSDLAGGCAGSRRRSRSGYAETARLRREPC